MQPQQEPRSKTPTETELVSETQVSNPSALPNPENNLVIKSLNEEDDAYKTPSFIMNPAHLAKSQQENEKLGQNIKLFPIFEDHQLARSSINYFLYLEFYHIAVRLFVQVLLFSMIIYMLYYFAIQIDSKIDTGYARVIAYAIGGVSATFILKYSLKREDKRLLEHDALYHFQWSEDLFSLLLTNLPKNCTKLEVQQHLQGILQKKQASSNANIIDIIFVHDYYKFAQLSKALKTHSDKLAGLVTQPSNKKLAQQKLQLEQKITTLKSQLNILQKEIQDSKHFRGTAIVIFNTIEAKGLILRHFTIRKLKAFFVFFFRICFRSYYLKGKKIYCREIPEPHNLLIENLHYPLRKRIWRTPLAYFTSSAVFIIALGTLGFISSWKLNTIVQHTASLLDNQYASYGVAIGTMIIATVLESIYRKTQNLFVYSSALRADISMVNYNMYVSFLLYVMIQGILGYGSRDLWIDQLIKLSGLYVLKRLVLKAFAFIAFIKPKESEESKGLLTGIVDKAKKKYAEFDFAKGLAYAFPLIFMGLAFVILHPFYLLPIFIASLYVFAVIDKYRMLKQCNLYSTKSAKFMLVHFWIYNWAPLFTSFFTIMIIKTYEKDVYPDAENNVWYGLPMWVGIAGFFFSMCCGKPLDQRVSERFAQRNSQVEYAFVSKEFSSFYQREDYSGNIKFNTVL